MEDQQRKIQRIERYGKMHELLDAGVPVSQIMQEELTSAFPLTTLEEKEQIMDGLLESSQNFMGRMTRLWEEVRTPEQMWHSRLGGLEETEQLNCLALYRLLCETVSGETIRELYENKKTLSVDELRDRLNTYCEGENKGEQIEKLLEWACRNRGLELFFWKQQQEILKKLRETGVEETAYEVLTVKADTVDERALFACALLTEPDAELGWALERIKTLPPREREELNLKDFSYIVASAVNACFERDRILVDLNGDLIDEEEAETRLARIWNSIEEDLIELMPALLGYLIFILILAGLVGVPMWTLYIKEIELGYALSMAGISAGLLVSLAGFFVGTAVSADPCEQMIRRIGNQIRWKSHEINKDSVTNYTKEQIVIKEENR